MSEQVKSMAYQLTINNPDLNHGEIHSLISFLSPRYYIYGVEKGEEKRTLHIHLYIHFGRYGQYFDKLKAQFPTAHIEICRGDVNSNYDYVTKGSKTKVSDTNDLVEGTYYEWGIKPLSNTPYSYSTSVNQTLMVLNDKIDELIRLQSGNSAN